MTITAWNQRLAPRCDKAEATGAFAASPLALVKVEYFIIPNKTRDTPIYKIVQTISDAMIPNGMSFCGLRASSAAVETESKPMYVKKIIAPPARTPANPEGANGCKLTGFINIPPTIRKVMMAPIFTRTITLLASADSRIPQTSKTVSTNMIRNAGTLKYAPVHWPSQGGDDHLSGRFRPNAASCALRYPPKPTATAMLLTTYSRMRSQPMIHAISSPR